MCLAIPALIKSIRGEMAEVEVAGVKRTANISLTPDAKVSDYVLLHAGYAIDIVDEKEARETLKLLTEIALP